VRSRRAIRSITRTAASRRLRVVPLLSLSLGLNIVLVFNSYNSLIMDYLESVRKQFAYYKMLGEKTMLQLSETQLFWQPDAQSNSIAMIVQHLSGNMLSRWTDFLTSDGEKDWRDRDAEFEPHLRDSQSVWSAWSGGWACFESALHSLHDADLERVVYIRNQGHSVNEAINRQLAHYPYHIGQMVLLAKMQVGAAWASLSIPKGDSQVFNTEKFAAEKEKKHFTDEFLKPS
jgi:hypothetical protein